MHAIGVDADKISAVAAVVTLAAVLPTIVVWIRRLIGSREEQRRFVEELKKRQAIVAEREHLLIEPDSPGGIAKHGPLERRVRVRVSGHDRADQSPKEVTGIMRVEEDGSLTLEVEQFPGAALQLKLSKRLVNAILDKEEPFWRLVENEEALRLLLNNEDFLRLFYKTARGTSEGG